MTIATKQALDTATKAVSSTEVQSTLVSMLDALQHGAVTVGNTVVKYAPDVVNASLWIVRIDGLQLLLWAISGTLFGLGLLLITEKLAAWVVKVDEDYATPACTLSYRYYRSSFHIPQFTQVV